MKSPIREPLETLRTFSLHALAVALFALACPPVNWAATANDQSLSCAQMEEFLRLGKIGQQKNIPKGVTLPTRATLEHNGVQHDAAVQTVNIAKSSYQTSKGAELNFKDFWGYNVAGYELAKILELNMVPPYVTRTGCRLAGEVLGATSSVSLFRRPLAGAGFSGCLGGISAPIAAAVHAVKSAPASAGVFISEPHLF